MRSSRDQLRFGFDVAKVESRDPQTFGADPFRVDYVDPTTREKASLKVKRVDNLPKALDRLRRRLRSPLPIAVSLVGPLGDGLTVGIDGEWGFVLHFAADPTDVTVQVALGNGSRHRKFWVYDADSEVEVLPSGKVIQAVERWVVSGDLDPALEWIDQ